MSIIYNRSSQKPYRRYLRNHSTQCERILWLALRGRQVAGAKFRRQHGIGRYVVDFYCPDHKLAIEIDGASHQSASRAEGDRQRQTAIEKYGIQFLRFTDEQVRGEVEEVLRAIRAKVNELNTIRSTTPLSPPR